MASLLNDYFSVTSGMNCQAWRDPSLAADITEFGALLGCQQVVQTVGSATPAVGLWPVCTNTGFVSLSLAEDSA